MSEGPAPPVAGSSQRWRRLLDIAKTINSELALDRVLSLVMSMARDLVTAEGCSLMLLDEQTNELVFHVALGGKGDELVERRVAVGEGVAGWVAATRSPAIVNDPANDPRFNREFAQKIDYPAHSLLCVPMMSRGRCVGVIEAINQVNGTGFTEEDQDLLEALADQAAIAVENSRLMDELSRTNAHLDALVNERTAALAETSQRLSAIVDATGEAMAVIDREFQVTWRNGMMAAWYGDENEVGDLRCYEAFHGREQPCDDCPIEKAFTSEQVEKTTRMVWNVEGAARYCDVTASPLSGEQGVAQVLEVVHDVTEIAQLEKERLRSAELAGVATTAASVNHEINNPLMGILGNVQLLKRWLGEGDTNHHRQLATIEEAALRIQEVTRRMASMAEPITREYAGHLQILDLGDTNSDQSDSKPQGEETQ